MSPPVDALVSRAVAGDSDALVNLLERDGPIVRGGLRIARRWQSVLDPADVMQVTYLEAALRIQQFEPQSSESFIGWLARIANNNLRDAIRGLEAGKRPNPKKRVQPVAGADSFVALVELVGNTSATPSRHLGAEEAKSALQRALRLIAPDYAMAIQMFDLDGKSPTEIASAMGRSVGAFYMMRARGLEKLRELLPTQSAFFSRVS